MANFNGTINNDTITGTGNVDNIDFSQGGNDTVSAGAGGDALTAGANFTALDQIDGGADYDDLYLNGNYSGGITLGANTLTNVEEIHLSAGNNYAIATHENTVAADQTLKLDSHLLGAGNSVIFDGSAETNGHFDLRDGAGNDTLMGGGQYDNISIGYGGNDVVHGGGGGDVINVEGALTTNDLVDGGAGSDVLYLRGDYSAGLTLDPSFVQSIESIGLLGDFTYNLVANDSFVAAGQRVSISGYGISGTGHMSFNGSAETDGAFDLGDSIGDDVIFGGHNDDHFIGYYGSGHDLLYGMDGDDSFAMGASLNVGDFVWGGVGNDSLNLNGDYSAGLTFSSATIKDIESISFTGGFSYNIKTANANIAAGETFTVIGNYLTATDSLTFDGSSETDARFVMSGGGGQDILTGGTGDDDIWGNDGNDILNGGVGMDHLNGGSGNDTAYGGLGDDDFAGYSGGNDSYYGGGDDDGFNFSDQFTTADFVDGGDGSNDHLSFKGDFSAGLTLGAASVQNIETISLGAGFNYNITAQDSLVAAGAQLEVSSFFNGPNNFLHFDGSAETDGSFYFSGGFGNDTLIGGEQADTFDLRRPGNDTMIGNGGDDTFLILSDLTAADHIDGGTGYDVLNLYGGVPQLLVLQAQTLQNVEEIRMQGGNDHSVKTDDANVAAGNVLKVDAHFHGVGDNVLFDGSAETDGSFNMITGAGTDTLTGGAMADTLNGGGGDDVLNGRGGADTMIGGAGNDWFYVDHAADVVNEAAAGGNDRVFAAVSYTLTAGQEIEKLSTDNNIGTSAINLTGNEFANIIFGNNGANILDGRGGVDDLNGLGGDDFYYVDNALDVVNEAAGSGSDRVFAGVSYALKAGQEVEKLTTDNNAGTGAINLTGNELANIIFGNAGANTLDGNGGADNLNGLGGDDFYYVDNALDGVTEAVGGGSDRVFASVSYALKAGQEIEKLTTDNNAGTGAINLTGNESANIIFGNNGANSLDGKGGADNLNGLGGDDFYYVDNPLDVVNEAAGEGNDRVFASVSYTLKAGQEIEKLTTDSNAGIGAINLTGNELANIIFGNAGANTIAGKLGNDSLTGLGGHDHFRFDTALNAATNVDTISDFTVSTGAAAETDKIDLAQSIFTTLGMGALSSSAFTTSAPINADQHIIYNTVTGALSYDDDGNGADMAVQFALLSTHPILSAADFLVV